MYFDAIEILIVVLKVFVIGCPIPQRRHQRGEGGDPPAGAAPG